MAVVLLSVMVYLSESTMYPLPDYQLPPATQPVEFVWWNTDGSMTACHVVDEPAKSWLRQLVSAPAPIHSEEDLDLDRSRGLEWNPTILAMFRIDGVQYIWHRDGIGLVYRAGHLWRRHYYRVWYASEFEPMYKTYLANPTRSTPAVLMEALADGIRRSRNESVERGRGAPAKAASVERGRK